MTLKRSIFQNVRTRKLINEMSNTIIIVCGQIKIVCKRKHDEGEE